jgi:phosphoglycolate phosphatase-like HAD superfamily hydrolase
MLERYKFILWDFDGVIIDSDRARVQGFHEVLKDFPQEEVDALIDFHARNGGLSRYVKFRHFYEVIRKEPISEDRVQELAKAFSEIMRVTLTSKSLLIEDAVSFIKAKFNSIPFHIVSGSDGNELRYLCTELGIAHMFKSIQGSPTPKTALVKGLIEQGIVDPTLCCLIGDAGNDFDAASANGIDFFGYNNTALSDIGKGYITRFEYA